MSARSRPSASIKLPAGMWKEWRGGERREAEKRGGKRRGKRGGEKEEGKKRGGVGDILLALRVCANLFPDIQWLGQRYCRTC